MATPKARLASLLASRSAPRVTFTATRAAPSCTPSFLSRPLQLAQSQTGARQLHSDAFARRASPIASTSALPRAFLAARIRSRNASTQSDTAGETGKKVTEVAVEQDEGDKAKGDKKVKLGEIRRLMVLAKPESKTIAIAIGLVRRCGAV